MSIYSASKLESLVFSNYYLRALFLTLKKVHVLFSSTKISFAESDSTSASTSRFTVMGVPVDKMARGPFFNTEKGSCFVFLDKDLISNFTSFHIALFFVCGW